MKNVTMTNTKKLNGQMAHKAQSDSSKATNAITAVESDVQLLIGFLVETQNVTADLSGKERQRLTGSRVKNSGFIDKSFDAMRDNPEFMPMNLTNAQMAKEYSRFEELRQLVTVTAHLNRIAVDLFMMQSDVCFKIGLRVYRHLQSLAKSGIPGATDLFQVLRWYFVNRAHKKSGEPTQKEIERDAKKLIKGTADGSMLIENQRPRVIEGKHKVVDNINTVKVAVEEIEKAN